MQPELPPSLRDTVQAALEHYLAHLEGEPVTALYDKVLQEVEAPLLATVMQYTHNNQSQASEILGLNRGTLRKKLRQYGLLHDTKL
ncbi:Fis family transcriptional regulator, factor for inversion stimulation protein [Allopseudospirillum japonicum]|uniref:Putative Fis-like DNA-binding protein n=1 Tax=Allopseudospirillum japonicum TaxID=64971 RepID=A0A1H6QFH7_9GAMM|nr:DNA-binding transcriptional regulator Fis [Allopseudospirillum japonicum]SEI42481.1 Fis family transcriptional regulator, factor for inversion stimulation protein [Allopseudospirillum japonicum]